MGRFTILTASLFGFLATVFYAPSALAFSCTWGAAKDPTVVYVNVSSKSEVYQSMKAKLGPTAFPKAWTEFEREYASRKGAGGSYMCNPPFMAYWLRTSSGSTVSAPAGGASGVPASRRKGVCAGKTDAQIRKMLEETNPSQTQGISSKELAKLAANEKIAHDCFQ